ncbi:hypothetical protein HPP92_009503 [Vanilla planifolia]|uniref:Uncharacterized protein n=1 Tax=Vanilla planifolia TaxID=51239 RepID=A0A835RBN2_VANPL|nr:hypothetical protein HPP92_009503 [Vanilla planifolia]
MYHPIAGHICHSNPRFSQIFHFSSSTTITAIFKSFKKKLAVACRLSTSEVLQILFRNLSLPSPAMLQQPGLLSALLFMAMPSSLVSPRIALSSPSSLLCTRNAAAQVVGIAFSPNSAARTCSPGIL